MRFTPTVVLLLVMSQLAGASAPQVTPPLLPTELPAWGSAHEGDAPAHPVRRVLDGRTIVVEIDGREATLVLRGVALPSLPGPREHPYLGRTHETLRNLVRGEFVRLDPIPKLDAETPVEADVYRQPDGLLINLELVRQGCAPVEREASGEHADLMRLVERRAKALGRGMWHEDWTDLVRSIEEFRPSQPGAGAGAHSSDEPVRTGVVFATGSGSKYHAPGCRYVGDGTPSMTLEEARRRGLSPCKVCKPE